MLLGNLTDRELYISLEFFIADGQGSSIECFNELNGPRLR